MTPSRAASLVAPALVCVLLSLTSQAQNATQRAALSNTVSIGDVIQAEDQKAVQNQPQGNLPGVPSAPVVTPIHVIYVHGMNETGPNESGPLRDAICRYIGKCGPNGTRIYAEGRFALGTYPPALTYLQQPIWSDNDWIGSTPFFVRYVLTSKGHAPIVFDEINWYPLVYPLKCRVLVAGDATLSGGTDKKKAICDKSTPDPDGHHFIDYPFGTESPIFDTDLPHQKGTWANRSLKVAVMDWGFGDAVLTLGSMREILFNAVRQLLVQSLDTTVTMPAGPSVNLKNPDIPIFFITHSLGSYISVAALDSSWLGNIAPELPEFSITDEQRNAVDFFSEHTTGFYFLANQVALLELARLTPPIPALQSASPTAGCPVTPPPTPNLAPAPENSAPEPVIPAISHYACMRNRFLLSQPANPALSKGPQIIAWSAADDLLTWYVPRIPKVNVVNLPAKNSGFRIWGVFASPTSVHANYAINKKVIRGIFNPTPPPKH